MDGWTDRQTDRQKDRQTDRQTGRERNRDLDLGLQKVALKNVFVQRLRQIIFPSAGWVAADPDLDGRMRRELGIPEREQPEVVVLKKPWENQEVEEEEEEGRNIIIQMLK